MRDFLRSKLGRTLIGLSLVWALADLASAQTYPVGHVTGDTNSAVIEGRVILPSGFSAERNVKITVKNALTILFTIHSNKNGEFRFHDLSEGIYYVQAEVDNGRLESAVEKVLLGRGITYELTLQLLERRGHDFRGAITRVVSAAELQQPVPAAAEREYKAALKLVAKGQVSQAAERFQQAINAYPEYLAARNDLGAQFLKLKRLEEAESHFRLVLERDPKNFYAMFNLGLVRIELSDYGEAASKLRQAIAIDSAWPTARLWLGFALLETGDLAGAERELTKALIMGGADCVAAHYHLARAYVKRGDPAGASRAVKAYLEEAPRGETARAATAMHRLIARLQALQPHFRVMIALGQS